jgi:hypothetical protein
MVTPGGTGITLPTAAELMLKGYDVFIKDLSNGLKRLCVLRATTWVPGTVESLNEPCRDASSRLQLYL